MEDMDIAVPVRPVMPAKRAKRVPVKRASGGKKIRIRDSEAAARAGVTPRTLRRWEEDPAVGFPAAHVIRGRRYRWLHEVEEWEQQNPGFGPK